MLNIKKILDTRIDNDLTQKKMAKILNISHYIYNNYETGRTRIPLNILLDFAQHFNLSLDYLLGLTKNKYNYNKGNLQNINHKLLHIRKNENLTQEKFGKLLGIPQRTYASYENGERPIPLEILLKISKVKNYSLDYLTSKSNNLYIKQGK